MSGVILNKIFIFHLIMILHLELYAGFWSCICPWKTTSNTKLISCVPQQNIDFIEKLGIGDMISFSQKGKRVEGRISDMSFSSILIEGAGKVHFSKLKELEVLDKSHRKFKNRVKDYTDLKQKELNFFNENQQFRDEVASFQKLSLEEKIIENKRIARVLELKMKTLGGSETLGFHFNLHGGVAIDYIEAGGIKASKAADIALQYGDRHAILDAQTYFFRTKSDMSLYDVISMGDMRSVFNKSGRMGSVLNIFKVDAKYFQDALTQGQIKDTGLSFIFKESFLQKQKTSIGIPYETYLMPPVELYSYKKFGFSKLSRDDIDFLALKQIEFYLKESIK